MTREPKIDPKVFIRAAVAESVFILGGIGLFFLTDQIAWIAIGAALGMAVLFAVILRASRNQKDAS